MPGQYIFAVALLVLSLPSILFIFVPWVRLLVRCRNEEHVDSQEVKRAAIYVGLGALCTGLILAALGLVLPETRRDDVSALAYLVYFLSCPGALVLVMLIGFGWSVFQLKQQYKE
jgi:hypothetical protein